MRSLSHSPATPRSPLADGVICSPLVSHAMSKVKTYDLGIQTEDDCLKITDKLLARIEQLTHQRDCLITEIQSLKKEIENNELTVKPNNCECQKEQENYQEIINTLKNKLNESMATSANEKLCSCETLKQEITHTQMQLDDQTNKRIVAEEKVVKLESLVNELQNSLSTMCVESNTRIIAGNSLQDLLIPSKPAVERNPVLGRTTEDKNKQREKINFPWFHLTDWHIKTWFDRFLKVPQNAVVITLVTSHLMKLTDCSDMLQKTCEDFYLQHYQYVLAVVNDREAEDAEGGSHWSLLVCNRGSGDYYHIDSIQGYNMRHAKKLANNINPYLNDGGGVARVVEVPCQQQVSGAECGTYVIRNAELVCSLILNNSLTDNDQCFLQSFSVDNIYEQIETYSHLPDFHMRENHSRNRQTIDHRSDNVNDEKESSGRSSDIIENACSPARLDHQIINQSRKKSRITVLTDSQGKLLYRFMRDLEPEYEVFVYSQPAAKMKQIIQSGSTFLHDFTYEDYVIVLAGTNNMNYGVVGLFTVCQSLKYLIGLNIKTNIVLCDIPYRFDDPHLNNEIFYVNNMMRDITNTFEGKSRLLYSGLNEVLMRENFTKHGLHFNNKGKIQICKLIKSVIKGGCSVFAESPQPVCRDDRTLQNASLPSPSRRSTEACPRTVTQPDLRSESSESAPSSGWSTPSSVSNPHFLDNQQWPYLHRDVSSARRMSREISRSSGLQSGWRKAEASREAAVVPAMVGDGEHRRAAESPGVCDGDSVGAEERSFSVVNDGECDVF